MTRAPLIVVGATALAVLLGGCSSTTAAPPSSERPAGGSSTPLPTSAGDATPLPTASPSGDSNLDAVVTATSSTTTTTTLPPRVLPSDVLFDSGSADLKPEAEGDLQTLAADLRTQAPNARLVITGHTDSQGSDDDNNALSSRRAEAVRNWLVSTGFAESSIEARGAGEGEPVVLDTDSDGRFIPDAGARNRRVEIVVVQ